MRSTPTHAALAAATAALTCTMAQAAITASWSGTGNWDDPTKWSTNPSIPQAVDDVAQLPNTSTGDGTTTLNIAGVKLGTLQNITPNGIARTWTINAADSNVLTMEVSTGSALILASSNTNVSLNINPAVVTNSDLVIRATGNDNLVQTVNLSNGLTGTGNVTTDFTGSGNNASAAINISSLNTVGTFTAQGNNSSNGTKTTTIGSVGSNVTTVTKTGSSVLVLNGTNSYTGSTTISGGVLRTNSLGSELLTLSGGAFEASGNFTRSLGSGAGNVRLISGGTSSGFSARDGAVVVALGGLDTPTALTWGSTDFAPSGLLLNAFTANNTLEFKNAIDLGASETNTRTIQVDSNVATISGNLTNSGGTQSLTKTGNGTLVLTGSNSYNGQTTVSRGTLRANDGSTLGGGRLHISPGNDATAVFETGVNMTRSLGTGAGQISTQNGNSNSKIGFSAVGGPVVVAIGGLDTPAALTWADGSNFRLGNSLVLNNANATDSLEFRNALNLNGATRTIQVDANVATASGVLSNSTGTAGLTKIGVGTLILSNNNTYNGTTAIRGGILRADDGVGIPTAPLVQLDAISGTPAVWETSADITRSAGTSPGNVQLMSGNGNGFSARGGDVVVSLGGLDTPQALTWGVTGFNPGTLILNAASADSAIEFRNSVSLGSSNATRTVQVNSNVATMSGILSNSGATLNLSKTGAGTLVLSNDNSYNGTTTVSAGTLLVNGSLDSRTSAVTVNAGATLGGSGTINRPVNVSGTLAAGNSPGTLDVVGNLALNTGSSFVVELNGTAPGDAATNYDQVNVTGTIDLTGTVNLVASVLPNGVSTISASDVFYILTRSGTGTLGTNVFDGLSEGAPVSLNGGLYSGQITYVANWTGTQAGSSLTGGNDVAIYNVVVPEPATLSLLGLAALPLLRRRRA